MVLNFITAVILFITTIILGYTILYVLFGRKLRERREAAFARMEQKNTGDTRKDSGVPGKAEGPQYGSYSHPAINDAMGFEFIRVIHPDIVSGAASSGAGEKSFADSRGRGAYSVQTESRDENEGYEDDGEFRFSLDEDSYPEEPAPLKPEDDAAYFDVPVMTYDAEEHIRELRENDEMMKKEMTMVQDALEFVRERDFAMPAGEGDMNEYQKGVLEMEDSRGENTFSSSDISRMILEAREEEALEEQEGQA